MEKLRLGETNDDAFPEPSNTTSSLPLPGPFHRCPGSRVSLLALNKTLKPQRAQVKEGE